VGAFKEGQPTPLDKYSLFQPANQCSIFSIIIFQMDLALYEAPEGRPQYIIDKEATLQPRIGANPSTSSTSPFR
jgi:hypothetical protein